MIFAAGTEPGCFIPEYENINLWHESDTTTFDPEYSRGCIHLKNSLFYQTHLNITHYDNTYSTWFHFKALFRHAFHSGEPAPPSAGYDYGYLHEMLTDSDDYGWITETPDVVMTYLDVNNHIIMTVYDEKDVPIINFCIRDSVLGKFTIGASIRNTVYWFGDATIDELHDFDVKLYTNLETRKTYLTLYCDKVKLGRVSVAAESTKYFLSKAEFNSIIRKYDVYLSEVIISDFDTVNARLMTMVPYSNGTYLDWKGNHEDVDTPNIDDTTSIASMKHVMLWVKTDDPKFQNINHILDIEGNDEQYIAVGTNGKLSKSTTQGNTWSEKLSGFGTTRITAIATDNDLWVAVGYYGFITTSTNKGEYWDIVDGGFNGSSIRDIVYNDEEKIWVAVGDLCNIRQSTDPMTLWTDAIYTPHRSSKFQNQQLNCIKYAKNMYVAGGDGGLLIVSYDLFSWSSVPNFDFRGANIRTIEYDSKSMRWFIGGDRGQLALTQDFNSFYYVKLKHHIQPAVPPVQYVSFNETELDCGLIVQAHIEDREYGILNMIDDATINNGPLFPDVIPPENPPTDFSDPDDNVLYKIKSDGGSLILIARSDGFITYTMNGGRSFLSQSIEPNENNRALRSISTDYNSSWLVGAEANQIFKLVIDSQKETFLFEPVSLINEGKTSVVGIVSSYRYLITEPLGVYPFFKYENTEQTYKNDRFEDQSPEFKNHRIFIDKNPETNLHWKVAELLNVEIGVVSKLS